MMRYRFLWLFCSLLTAVGASALDNPPPDAARKAATAYLDALAATDLNVRTQIISGLNSASDVEKRQTALRRTILSLIGGLPDRRTPVHAQVTGTRERAGYRIENVVFESLPGYRVTANVYVPAGKGPFPAVVISPGHSPAGKAGEDGFSANFARAGILAFAYDIVGEGERWQNYDPELDRSRLERPTGEHSLMAYQTLLMGEHVSRYFLNDAMAGIDYLTSRADVDANRIGAYGCSGGGTMTAYLAAMDPRVKVAASACFVTTMRHLLKSVGPQDGEQSIPGFTAAGFDLPDWVELAAPKPYAIVSTTGDMFPFAGAREVYAEAKRIWGLFGAADKLHWITGPGRHGALAPISADIVAFFLEYLKGETRKPDFVPPDGGDPADLLVTESGQLSTSIGSETIQTLMAKAAKGHAAAPASVATEAQRRALARRLRRDIRQVTHTKARPGHMPASVETGGVSNYADAHLTRLTFRPADGPEFSAVLATPAGKVRGRMIWLPASANHSYSDPADRLRLLARRGWQVLSLVPAGGHGEEIKAQVLGDYTLFALRAMLVGRTITGLRIDQILTAADWLSQRKAAGPLLLCGGGGSGPAVLHAALLDSRITGVIVEKSQAAYRFSTDRPVSRDLPEIALPGVLLHYDLPDLAVALSPRPVWFVAPADQLGKPLGRDAFARTMAAAFRSERALKQTGRIKRVPVFSPDILEEK